MNKPKIRFKGFEGEWEKKMIGEVANVIGGGTPSTNNSIYWDGPIQWFTPSEVGQIKYIEKSQRTITTAGLEKSSAKLIPANSVLLSSRATIGEMSINACECTTNQGFQSLVPCKTDLEFLYSLMLTKKNDLIRISHGSTFLEISASKVRSVNICVPKLDEQQEIGTYFKQLDSLISLTEKKISSLKQVKQASLQSMFPQEGETTPRIRFKGFEGEWEKCKVSNLFAIKRGYVLPISKTKAIADDEYKYPVYSSQTLRNGLMGYYNQALYKDAITWTTDGANAGTVNFRPGYFYCTNVCGVLTSDRGYANACIAEILGLVAKKYVSFVGNPKLMNNVMAEIQIYIPTSLQEQTQIADYFSNLDKQIALHEARLEKLKSVKASCLDLMFV